MWFFILLVSWLLSDGCRCRLIHPPSYTLYLTAPSSPLRVFRIIRAPMLRHLIASGWISFWFHGYLQFFSLKKQNEITGRLSFASPSCTWNEIKKSFGCVERCRRWVTTTTTTTTNIHGEVSETPERFSSKYTIRGDGIENYIER